MTINLAIMMTTAQPLQLLLAQILRPSRYPGVWQAKPATHGHNYLQTEPLFGAELVYHRDCMSMHAARGYVTHIGVGMPQAPGTV